MRKPTKEQKAQLLLLKEIMKDWKALVKKVNKVQFGDPSEDATWIDSTLVFEYLDRDMDKVSVKGLKIYAGLD